MDAETRQPETYTEFKKTLQFLAKFLRTWPSISKVAVVKWTIKPEKRNAYSKYPVIKLKITGRYIRLTDNKIGDFVLWDKTPRRYGKGMISIDLKPMCNSSYPFVCRYYDKNINEFREEIDSLPEIY